jgi:hypothetical protein
MQCKISKGKLVAGTVFFCPDYEWSNPLRAVLPILGALLLTLIFHVVDAEAASIDIVALGASQTAGRGNGLHSGGVSPEQAFPAQLESMLRARGYDARVTNAGIAGDTTDGMLARLDSSVPAGTKLVIFQPKRWETR